MVSEGEREIEFGDAMAPCLKLQGLAIFGRRTFKLKDLFEGQLLDPVLAETEFLVPLGHLTLGGGQQEAQTIISKEQLPSAIEDLRQAIINSQHGEQEENLVKQLQIGYTGTKATGQAH